MVERSPQFEWRQLPFGGFGSKIIGIVFFRTAEPGDEFSVFNGKFSIPNPILQFRNGQWAHLIFNQYLQCMIFSQTATVFQATCSPEFPPLGSRGTFCLPPFFFRNPLLEYDHSRINKHLLKRIQNCPAKRIRSDIKSEDTTHNFVPFLKNGICKIILL